MVTYRQRLNVCVPSKFIYTNLVSNMMVFRGGAFRRGLGQEGGILMREVLESSLVSILSDQAQLGQPPEGTQGSSSCLEPAGQVALATPDPV